MKKINMKSLMLMTFLFASVIAMPSAVAAYGTDDDNYNFNQMGSMDPSEMIGMFDSGFTSIFSQMGYAGNLIGKVFQMLLMQGLTNFSNKQILPGVYVLSASTEELYNGTKDYGPGIYDFYFLPYEYNSTPIETANDGYAYCLVKKTGTVSYNITIGAAVTLVIWDHDGSFIRAVNKIVSFFHKLRFYMRQYGVNYEGLPEGLIREGIATITWFLVHINDIFTGEELFTLNPITWQKIDIRTSNDFNITKTWYVTDDYHINPMMDPKLESRPYGPALMDEWNSTAKLKGDNYMQWLLRETEDVKLKTAQWTTFTFDLVQLWIKNFEIHIDVGELMNAFGGDGGPVDVAKIFQGLDIEFYLFTHHLAGAFLYNDTNADNMVSVEYEQLNITTPDGTPVEVPRTTELTHRLVLNSVEDFDWQPPHLTGSNKFSWGLDLIGPFITPVPIGVDLESYLGADDEKLGYIHFGFTFEPDTSSLPVLYAPTKVDQEFAPWNNETGPYSNNNIAGLDLAVIYLSTMLHFHLNVQTIGENASTAPTGGLDPSQDYNNQTHKLRVGNYLGAAFGAQQLDFVDIAGPGYDYGYEGNMQHAAPTSNIIPLALYEAEVEKHDTFTDSSGNKFKTFATDISLNVSFNVLAYAICYPAFEDGNGIWHDPTFSVYMIFEAKGFWALILLIAGVGFVGIATILIKRRKDARF